MKWMLTIVFILSAQVFAIGGDVELDHAAVDLHDKASLQRGAQLFINYCMGCHSAQFQRYERTANDIGIPNHVFEDNLLFGDAKIGELMKIAMSIEDGKKWFGAPPPDLTLTARLRGPDWLYTYLRSFYVDESRPWGVNNTVFKNVGMPHALMELQGEQRLVCKHAETADDLHCDSFEVTENTGKLTNEQYDMAILDLVNFLTYLGEPSRLESNRIGVYVILFLIIMLVFAYLLKREYWKDVH